MSSPRTTSEKQLTPFNFVRDMVYPGTSTLLTHPCRVALNLSPHYTSLSETVVNTFPRLFSGIAMNVFRGSCSSGSQFFAKRVAQEYAGFGAGVLAASCSGTIVATFVETRLIRKNNLPVDVASKPSLWRINRPLSALYFSREFGFTMGVLTKQDLPPYLQNVVLLASAAFTSTIHKLSVSEATRDFLPKGMTVPDFREGVAYTIRNIAAGNHYTHPAFQVKYPNPETHARALVNFMSAACGRNVFCFRLLYLFAFREVYNHMPAITDSLTNHAGLFRQPVANVNPAALPVSATLPDKSTRTMRQ